MKKALLLILMFVQTLKAMSFDVAEVRNVASDWRSAEIVTIEGDKVEARILLLGKNGSVVFARDFERSILALKEIYREQFAKAEVVSDSLPRSLIKVLSPASLPVLELYPLQPDDVKLKEVLKVVADGDAEFFERVKLVNRMMQTKALLNQNPSKQFFAFLEGNRVIFYTVHLSADKDELIEIQLEVIDHNLPEEVKSPATLLPPGNGP